MTRKSIVTDRLISAQDLDSSVNSAQRFYDKAVSRTAQALADLAAAQEDLSVGKQELGGSADVADSTEIIRLQEAVTESTQKQQIAYERLLKTLGDKKALLEQILLTTQQQIDEWKVHPDALSELGKEQATVLRDNALVIAALSDLEAKIKELEKKQQGKRKRNPAPSKRNRKGSIEAQGLTKEIVAVLAEADKVKTTKNANTDNTARYRLKAKYNEYVVPELQKQFKYKNVNEVPKLEKILLNMGLGDVKDDGKKFNNAVEELKIISGQKPIPTTAKKSIANFKVRQGMNIGAKVTLRGKRMYEFFDKLVSVALPRVRDFKGVSVNSFDGRGNYAMGVKEQLIFPEIKYDKIDKVRGFDIAIVTSAKTDEEAKALLTLLGMPFKA